MKIFYQSTKKYEMGDISRTDLDVGLQILKGFATNGFCTNESY